MYEYTPFSLNQLKAKQSDIRKEAYDLKFILSVEFDGLHNETGCRNVLVSSYNLVTHVQLSEFDIWHYQRTSSDKIVTSIGIDSVHKHNKGDLNSKTCEISK